MFLERLLDWAFSYMNSMSLGIAKQITGPWIDELDTSQIQPRTGVFSVAPFPGSCDTFNITGFGVVVIQRRYHRRDRTRRRVRAPISSSILEPLGL